jgi:hypothetical protein
MRASRLLVLLASASCGGRAHEGPPAAADASTDAPLGELCALPPPAGAAVTCLPGCDPSPDGGPCSGVPIFTSRETSVTLWIEAPSAPGGGYRLKLAANVPIGVAGHVYEDRVEGFFASGANGNWGDVFIAVDGVGRAVHFHLEGGQSYLGGGIWSWSAALTRENVSCPDCGPMTIARHYTTTRSGGACPDGGAFEYTSVADEPPQTCGIGVDLLEVVIPD